MTYIALLLGIAIGFSGYHFGRPLFRRQLSKEIIAAIVGKERIVQSKQIDAEMIAGLREYDLLTLVWLGPPGVATLVVCDHVPANGLQRANALMVADEPTARKIQDALCAPH
jgi:hypothetical protein